MYNVILVSSVQHSNSTTLYVVLCSSQVQLPSFTIHCYHKIIDHVTYAAALATLFLSSVFYHEFTTIYFCTYLLIDICAVSSLDLS